MKVKSIKIKNFKGIRDIEIVADGNINVIVGVNGAGKSTILQALNHLFSWYTARMKNVNGKGTGISVQDININGEESLLEIILDNDVCWTLYKQKPSKRQKPTAKTDLSSMTRYANELIEEFSANPESTSLPLIASYNVNRTITDIPVGIRKKHQIDPMSIYDVHLMNGVNFRSFFEWFREREDLENEKMRYESSNPDNQLNAVRNAIRSILPEYGELRVRRSPRSIVLEKNNVEFRIDQLSDGEKCYLTLIADIARRLATANPGLDNPLIGEGIILIDELDLHLHPSWQAEAIPKMRNAFPNCQFFLTTHSPHIVANIRSFENEQFLIMKSGEKIHSSLLPFGKTTDSILTDFFQLDTVRNKETQYHLDHIWGLLGANEYQSEEFETHLQWLKSHIGESDIEVVRIIAEKTKLIKLEQ